MTTIGLHMIVRQAGRTLRECLESVAPHVDQIVIGLAGDSTDETEAIAREFTDEVFSVPWRDDFAWARNKVLGRIRTDWALWLDADDILVGGEHLRRVLAGQPEANALFLRYLYEQDDRGNLLTVLWRERVVRPPAAWTWKGAIHEVMALDEAVPLVPAHTEEVQVVHNPRRERDKGERNLRLLFAEIEKTEPDPEPRLLLYAGRESASRGRPREAIAYWTRYLAVAEPSEEKAQIAAELANVFRSIGDLDRAERADLRSITWAPHWPSGFFGMARTAYQREDWPGVIEWSKAAQTKDMPRTQLILNELEFTYYPVYFVGLAYAQMGDTEMALTNLTQAAAVVPDPVLLETIAQLRREHDAQTVLRNFMGIYEHLARWDEWLKVRELFRVAPKLIETHPEVRQAWLRTAQQTAHVDDPQIMVQFYRGNPDWQPMSDEYLWSAEWAAHPRMAWARKVLCEPPKFLLDIGSSDGFISLPLAKDGHAVVGYDLDPRCVELANERAQRLGLGAQYRVGSVEDLGEDEKYDVALAFEVIEHLVDPDAFLDALDERVRKVALTTPFLAWENGRLPASAWQKVEPKGHLRIYDLADMERLVAHRGRVLDLYREPWGESAWIFCSYRPGEQYAGSVTFVAPGTIEEWSPRKYHEQGLGGSETALIRLTEELAAGHGLLPTVFGRIDNPGYYSGVRYRTLDALLPEVRQDSVVAWRYPEAADLPWNTSNLVLWCHDTDYGERLTPARARAFSSIVVLSEWHREHMLQTYPWLESEKLTVIGNGIDPERFTTDIKRDPRRVIYASSPDRGLDVILEHVWPKVREQVPDAELHVFYGWNNWTPEMVAAYPHLADFRERMAELMLNSTGVVNHGRVNQAKLAEEMLRSSIWLYPTYFDETSCIVAAEAQAAGLIPVTNRRAALAETVGEGVIIDGDVRDPTTAARYADETVRLLRTSRRELSLWRRRVRDKSPAVSWAEVSDAWIRVLGRE